MFTFQLISIGTGWLIRCQLRLNIWLKGEDVKLTFQGSQVAINLDLVVLVLPVIRSFAVSDEMK